MYNSDAVPTTEISYLEVVYLAIVYSINYRGEVAMVPVERVEQLLNVALSTAQTYAKMKPKDFNIEKKLDLLILKKSLPLIPQYEQQFSQQIKQTVTKLKSARSN